MRVRRRTIKWGLFAVVAILSALDHAGAFGYRGDDRSRFDGTVCRVVSVLDPCTVEVDLADRGQPTTHMRLIGIEPFSGAPGADGSRAPAARTTESLAARYVECRVRILLDPKVPPRDDTGRLFAYLRADDSHEIVNERLLEEGLVRTDAESRCLFRDRYHQLQKRAMKQKTGMWADRPH